MLVENIDKEVSSEFDGKVLLITGGTGSFGNAVLRRFLNEYIRDIPRTTLRYAIERMDENERERYLRL